LVGAFAVLNEAEKHRPFFLVPLHQSIGRELCATSRQSGCPACPQQWAREYADEAPPCSLVPNAGAGRSPRAVSGMSVWPVCWPLIVQALRP
jgi:hypothetical protein